MSRREGTPSRLLALNPNGRKIRLIATDVENPVWSPDGSKVAFTSESDGNIYAMNPDGSGRQGLASPEVSGQTTNVTWSPDGSRLVFDNCYGGIICSIEVDGAKSSVLALVSSPSPREVELTGPALSPDGNHIAFLRDDFSLQKTALVVADAHGDAPRTVFSNANSLVWPSWSPNSRWLAFGRQRYAGTTVALVHPDGTGLRDLTRPADLTTPIVWSSDGERIAFYEGLDPSTVFVVPTRGGVQKEVGICAGSGEDTPVDLAWSPVDEQLAMACSGDIWVMRGDGTHRHKLINTGLTGGVALSPRWDPLGRNAEVLGNGTATAKPPSVPTASLAGRHVFRAEGRVVGMAADGTRLALNLKWNGTSCDHVEVWDVAQHTATAFPGQEECGGQPDDQENGLVSVSIAGRRVLWVEYGQDNHLYAGLSTATIDRPDPVSVPVQADAFGDPVGSGPLLVFASWAPRNACDCVDDLSTAPFEKGLTSLWRIRGGHAVHLASEARGLTPFAVDGSAIATLRGDGTIEILDRTGQVRRTISPSGKPRSISLDGRQIVVSGPRGLDVYDRVTGTQTHHWRVGIGDGRVLAAGGVAGARSGRTIYLVRLGDGRRTTLTAPTGGSIALSRSGLFYSYGARLDQIRPARVAFMPMRAVLARFG